MSSLSPSARRPTAIALRSLLVGAGFALALAGCSAASATFPPLATASSAATATATATAANTASASVAGATGGAAPTPTDSPTAAPTATAAPTSATATLPPLAVGLCVASQLRLTLDYWVNDGAISYAHVYVTNVSSKTCNMRGTPRSQVVDANNLIIVDSGSTSARVSSSDMVVKLGPGAKSYDIIQWGNWCKAAPPQNVKTEVVLPFGLGPVLSKASGAAPIPSCYASGGKSAVSAEAWQP